METLVLYHIPSDRDDPETPNAFVIPKPAEQISLKDVHENFPLPGEYHFRIKHGNNLWLDLRPGQPLTISGKRIVLKALRVSWNSRAAPVIQTAQAAAAPRPSPAPAPTTVDSFDAFFG